MPRGRPKNPETAKKFDKALELVATGMGMQKACDQVGVDRCNFFTQMKKNEELASKYARARERQADHLADEIVQIADEEECPNKARVRIDARKWTASKLRPKRYGDKVDLNHNHSGTVKVTIGGKDE